MSVAAELKYMTLGQLLVECPARLAVFERFGLDCFCAGRLSVGNACAARGVDPVAVSAALLAVDGPDDGRALHVALNKIIRHLDEVHHAPMRREMARLGGLLERAVGKQGGRFAHLARVLAAYSEWARHMDEHMREEEDGVFAMCRAIIAERHDEVKRGAVAA